MVSNNIKINSMRLIIVKSDTFIPLQIYSKIFKQRLAFTFRYTLCVTLGDYDYK